MGSSFIGEQFVIGHLWSTTFRMREAQFASADGPSAIRRPRSFRPGKIVAREAEEIDSHRISSFLMDWKSRNLATSTLLPYIAPVYKFDARQNEHPIPWAPTSDSLSAPSACGTCSMRQHVRYELLAAREVEADVQCRSRKIIALDPSVPPRSGSQPVRVSSMRSQAIVRELVQQLLQADADEERRKEGGKS
jgi:hypothetical protein